MLHLVVLALSLKVNIYSPVALTIKKKKKKKNRYGNFVAIELIVQA